MGVPASSLQPLRSSSCAIHTVIHTPARKSYANFQLDYFVMQLCSTNCLGHGHRHGYECHSSVLQPGVREGVGDDGHAGRVPDGLHRLLRLLGRYAREPAAVAGDHRRGVAQPSRLRQGLQHFCRAFLLRCCSFSCSFSARASIASLRPQQVGSLDSSTCRSLGGATCLTLLV